MIIYKVSENYGAYNGSTDLGYFQSIESAKKLVFKTIEKNSFKIFEVIEYGESAIYYRISESDYIYEITSIRVEA
jgi:hypothetical protein